ncbi:MAG TPA: hypothetical protein VN328_00015, partial [Thermodesulfovibrionales bacterium]|nr:hypothetical protein [Thermodesulfovibrionales bacterium]
AGVLVNYFSDWAIKKKGEAQQVKNLKFEIQLDIEKVDKWLEEIVLYRNATNGDTLDQYFGYFDFSRFIYVTANSMFISGLLYKYLDHEKIGLLQVITSEFSVNGEKFINDQLAQNRQKFIDSKNEMKSPLATWTSKEKSGVVKNIDFWEKKFKEHKASLQRILVHLK